MQDQLIGTWILDPGSSNFDANHRPRSATMIFERDGEGYRLTAEGVDEKGAKCREKPQQFIPDGKGHPVPDFPGLTATVTRPDARTLHCEVRREDGSAAGGGTYAVSEDGQRLTATNFGYDTQLRQFKQETVWVRQ